MLTLLPGSYCDVCAEEYGPHCLPHSIPCGHVLCASCCRNIVEKTSPRHSPVCPFCREQYTTDDARLIRTDFSSSGWNTPRRVPVALDSNATDSAADLWAKREERLLMTEGGCSRVRDEARRLEDKVAKVAAKKCSVEEVSTLHNELEQWLKSAVKLDDQTSSLYLSAALLRAILMNHIVHSEASKNAKTLEANLKGKLDDLEITNGKLEEELRRQRALYQQKAQECQTLRTELSRLKVVATTLGSIPNTQTESPSRARAMSPPPAPPTPAPTPGLSRYNSLHARSTSISSSRPSTPAYSVRSYTPSLRSHSHTLSTSGTLPMRLPTPSPVTTTPSRTHTHTPAPPPPPIPPKPRRLSHPSPPKMARSVSEEKQEIHERWIPPRIPDEDLIKTRRVLSRAGSVTPKHRAARSPSPSYH